MDLIQLITQFSDAGGTAVIAFLFLYEMLIIRKRREESYKSLNSSFLEALKEERDEHREELEAQRKEFNVHVDQAHHEIIQLINKNHVSMMGKFEQMLKQMDKLGWAVLTIKLSPDEAKKLHDEIKKDL